MKEILKSNSTKEIKSTAKRGYNAVESFEGNKVIAKMNQGIFILSSMKNDFL